MWEIMCTCSDLGRDCSDRARVALAASSSPWSSLSLTILSQICRECGDLEGRGWEVSHLEVSGTGFALGCWGACCDMMLPPRAWFWDAFPTTYSPLTKTFPDLCGGTELPGHGLAALLQQTGPLAALKDVCGRQVHPPGVCVLQRAPQRAQRGGILSCSSRRLYVCVCVCVNCIMHNER